MTGAGVGQRVESGEARDEGKERGSGHGRGKRKRAGSGRSDTQASSVSFITQEGSDRSVKVREERVKTGESGEG